MLPRCSAAPLRFVVRCALAALLLLIGLTTIVSTADAQKAARATKERSLRACADHLRLVHNLPPLTTSRQLNKAARLQARQMARQNFFSHSDPKGRGPAGRVRLFTDAYDRVGENIAAGQTGARSACRSWRLSAEHLANILNPAYTAIGAGYARGGRYGRYYTQVFGAH